MHRALRNAQPPSVRRSTPRCSRRALARPGVRAVVEIFGILAGAGPETRYRKSGHGCDEKGKNGHYGPQLPHIGVEDHATGIRAA